MTFWANTVSKEEDEKSFIPTQEEIAFTPFEKKHIDQLVMTIEKLSSELQHCLLAWLAYGIDLNIDENGVIVVSKRSINILSETNFTQHQAYLSERQNLQQRGISFTTVIDTFPRGVHIRHEVQGRISNILWSFRQ